MKIGELKIIHIVLVLALILWVILFFDFRWTMKTLNFEKAQVIGVINDLNRRVSTLEGNKTMPIPPPKPKGN